MLGAITAVIAVRSDGQEGVGSPSHRFRRFLFFWDCPLTFGWRIGWCAGDNRLRGEYCTNVRA